jgi:hypothetical protein
MAGPDKKKSKVGKAKGETGPLISTYNRSLRYVLKSRMD